MASICCIPTLDVDEESNSNCFKCQYSPSPQNGDEHCQDIKMAVKSGPHRLHAVAKEDIVAGTVIVQCLPISQSPIIHGPVKNTCFRCFFQEGDIDISGRRKKETLFRCARCQIARYCSKECQMSDWKQHKLECLFYVKQRKAQHHSYPESGEEAGMPKALMLRSFAALKHMKEANETTEAKTVKNVVNCGPNHFSSLSVSSQHQSPSQACKDLRSPEMKIVKSIMLQHAIGNGKKQNDTSSIEQTAAALKVWGYGGCSDEKDSLKTKSFTLDQALLRTDDAFKKNNFGILDAMHSSIGEGIYPCAALLNHSCSPNAILRYRLDDGADLSATSGKSEAFNPPLLQIVACKDVAKGEELTHSYVDLMLSTKDRRDRLLKTHGFTCQCERCLEDSCVVQLPRDRMIWGKWPLENKLSFIDQRNHSYDDDIVEINLEMALQECNLGGRQRDALSSCAELLTSKAHQSMLRDDVKGELNNLQRAVNLWDDTNIDCWWTPFNLQLYSVRSQYFTALLSNQKIEEAVDQLEFVISTMMVAFSHVLNHPLLGLQLFTLGDLYAYRGREWERKAYLTYIYAKDIMVITHGVDHPMVLQLQQRIAELSIAS